MHKCAKSFSMRIISTRAMLIARGRNSQRSTGARFALDHSRDKHSFTDKCAWTCRPFLNTSDTSYEKLLFPLDFVYKLLLHFCPISLRAWRIHQHEGCLSIFSHSFASLLISYCPSETGLTWRMRPPNGLWFSPGASTTLSFYAPTFNNSWSICISNASHSPPKAGQAIWV